MTVACPRHGVVAVAANAPCPGCRVACYDLEDPAARQIVRQNRDAVLRRRGRVASAVVVVVSFWAVLWAVHLSHPTAELVELVVTTAIYAGFPSVVLAVFLGRTLAALVEPDPRVRQLDRELRLRRS